jgi:hypothetical protein
VRDRNHWPDPVLQQPSRRRARWLRRTNELSRYAERYRRSFEGLPKMAKAANSDKLRTAFEKHHDETEGRAARGSSNSSARRRAARSATRSRASSTRGGDHGRIRRHAA